MPINLDNYVTVADRVAKFYKDYPKGRIHTKILRLDSERVVVEAMVWKARIVITAEFSDKALEIAATPDGVGQAEEIRTEGLVNRTNALENAETSAIGRALAHMGYEVSKSLSSREAVQSAQEVQEQMTKPVNPAQKQRIYQLLEKLETTPTAYEKTLGKQINSLTLAEAADLVAELTAEVQRKQAENVKVS